MDVTPDLAQQYHLPAPLGADNGVTPNVFGSGNTTCRMSQTELDGKGLVLIEADTYQSWSHNGTYITSTWGNHTGMSWAPDGWNGFSNWASYSLTGPPYGMFVSGGATFEFLAGSYHTVMTNNFSGDGYGNCSVSSWSHTGTTVPLGYWTISLSNS
jgi:hypothetical protein